MTAADLGASECIREDLGRVLAGTYDVPDLELSKPTILDLGANVGAFAVWAAKRWPGAEIYCFEPQADAFALLEQNVGRHCPPGSTCCVRRAVRAEGHAGWGNLRHGRTNPGAASFHDLGEQELTSERVLTMAARDLPRADVVKIDTEGCELEILQEISLEGVKAVLLEWHRMADRPALRRLLEPQGFVCVEEVPGGIPGRGILKFVRGRRHARGVPRVFLGSPIYKGAGHPQFRAAVAACQALDSLSVDFYAVQGDADITRARAAVLGKYLDEGHYEFLLMADSDISWHPSVLEALVGRNLPVVGAAYAFKAAEGYLAGKAVLRAEPLRPEPGDDGLMPVRYLGGGFVLVRDDLVRRLCAANAAEEFWTNPDHRDPGRRTFALWDPLLVDQPDWGPGMREKLSEDYAFCERVRRLGETCWLDVYAELVHWDGERPYLVERSAA